MTSSLAGFPFSIQPPTEDDKMINQLDERLDELRQKYRTTNEREFYFRFLEAQRIREVAVNDQIRREQDSRRSKRGSED